MLLYDHDVAYIYTLAHPSTGRVRYVGRALEPSLRLYQHTNYQDKTPKGKWLARLAKEGKSPVMRVIDKVPAWKASATEYEWVRYYNQQGELLNTLTPPGPLPHPLKIEMLQQGEEWVDDTMFDPL